MSNLDLGKTYDVVSSKRRRILIRTINEEGRAKIGELAEQVAAEENDKKVEQVSSDERKRVYISIYQIHTEPLEEVCDVVDERARVFEATEETEKVVSAMEDFEAYFEDEGGVQGFLGRVVQSFWSVMGWP